MSSTTTKKHKLSLQGFRGVDCRSCQTDEQAAAEIVNFRVLNSGSLEKRNGYRLLASMKAPIRAMHTAFVDGKKVIYVLSGKTLSSVDLQSGETTNLGTIQTTEGNACIFFYRHLLYLMDGVDIFCYADGALTPVSAYIPLIGKDWPSNYLGEPYEPKNILTRRARISYLISPDLPSIFMRTGEPIESVDAVYRNGELLDPDQYYIDEEFETVNVRGAQANDRIEIYMTMQAEPNEALRQLFLSASRSILFSGGGNSRIFFWGATDPSLMFCTGYVPAEQLAATAKHNTAGNDLYIPNGYEFRVGASGHQIQGCAPHYDRLLIFTEEDAWMATPDASGLNEYSVIAINRDIGCASRDGVASVGNHPISLGRQSLYQWHQGGDVPNRCNATRVSEEIDALIPAENYANSILHYDLYRNELWFCHCTSGTVWVRNLTNNAWYSFNNIRADRFFDADGCVGFLKDGNIFVFDEERDYDQPLSGQRFFYRGFYKSGLSNFGTSRTKCLSHAELHCESGEGSLSISFIENNERHRLRTLFTKEPQKHMHLRVRLPSARFQFGCFSLSAIEGGRPVIHDVTLYTR